MFTFYFIIKVYVIRVDVGDDLMNLEAIKPHFQEIDGILYKLRFDSNRNEYYEATRCVREIHYDYKEKGVYDITIPSYIYGLPVKVIGSNCFLNCNNVRKIKLSDGIIRVESSVFSGCPNLKSLELPNTIRIFNSNLNPTVKIKLNGDWQFIPSLLIGNINLDMSFQNNLLKSLDYDGHLDGVVWYSTYRDHFGYTRCMCKRIMKKNTKEKNTFEMMKGFENSEYSISFDAEKEYFDSNSVEFAVGDLNRFNIVIYLLYPTLNDIPTPVPDFSKLFVNFKEWINLGLDLQIIYNNPNIVFKSVTETIDNIYNNYNLLNSQNNMTSQKMLQKIYFGFEFDSKEEMFGKLQKSIRDNCKIEPTTVVKLMEDSSDDLVKQKLKDSLIYASHIVPMNRDVIENKNMIKLREIIAHDVFENISKANNEVYHYTYGFYPERYSLSDINEDVFDGAHYHIRKELEKINPNFYNEYSKVNLSPTELSVFLENLNTIKNWDKLSTDKKKKATLLKNEVIGRVLYATMRTTLESDESFVQTIEKYKSEALAIENNSELPKKQKKKLKSDLNTELGKKVTDVVSQMNFYNTDLSENKDIFMKYLFYTDFNSLVKDDLDLAIDREIIKKMIELNPYTFDMLRDGKQVNMAFYKKAFDSNYLFREQEDFNILKKVNSKQEQNPFSVIAQYMLNDIENNPKSEKFDATFAINIRRMLDEYFYNRDSKDGMFLFDIFRGIDVFLRKKSSIDAQEILDGNVRSLSNEIFDISCKDKYNNYDRLCYSLFNLNRLAHDIHNISMKKLELDFNRYKNDSLELNKLQRILNSYERLSRFGLMPKDMNFLFENNKRFAKMITDENFSTNQKTLLLNSILPETIKEIDDDNLDEIIECFEEIMNVDENVRNQIELDAEEQKMDYDAKRVVGENFVRMLSEFASNSLDNQKEFFKKYGFVVECQYDVSNRGNDLLVVYNPKFGKTFSIHMKDMDDETRNIFDANKKVGQTRTLCCTQVNGGLVGFEQAVIDKKKELIDLPPSEFANSGDYPDRNLLNASVQFHNFLEYDCEVYREKIDNANGNQEELKRVILEIFDGVPIKNFDEVNIKKDNGDGTYSSTKILSLISDKIGIRLDTAIDTVNDIMSREENEKIVKFDDKYAGLVVHCLEQLNKKFLIADANYQNNELGDMMYEYVTPGTDAVSQNKHI